MPIVRKRIYLGTYAVIDFDHKVTNSSPLTHKLTSKRQYFNYFKDRLAHFYGTVVIEKVKMITAYSLLNNHSLAYSTNAIDNSACERKRNQEKNNCKVQALGSVYSACVQGFLQGGFAGAAAAGGPAVVAALIQLNLCYDLANINYEECKKNNK